jgi:Peptidase family M48
MLNGRAAYVTAKLPINLSWGGEQRVGGRMQITKVWLGFAGLICLLGSMAAGQQSQPAAREAPAQKQVQPDKLPQTDNTAPIQAGGADVTSDPPAAADSSHIEGDTLRNATAKPQPVPGQSLSGAATARSFSEVVDRAVERERAFLDDLEKFQPLIETYIQNTRQDADLGLSPADDHYFLGHLELTDNGARERSYLGKPGMLRGFLGHITKLYSMEFLPLGFAQMVLIDNGGFDRTHYDFSFVRREFLGDVRCVVADVVPKKHAGSGRFVGRIWIEDQDYNIIRFNGTYAGAPRGAKFLHFDSWRLNMQPGMWLPGYIYSEESDLAYRLGTGHLRYKAITRLWGYNLQQANRQSEMTEVRVDADNNVKDQSEQPDLSPAASNRQWQRQAEDNSLDRLERAGLIAPRGDIDKILQTVVNNLEITNKLEIAPEVRCRVLLTTPLESFTVGHTIVLSRGLIDVLPDESTLAAVVAHELAHIALDHQFDTRYAFADRMFFQDEDTYRKMSFHRNAADEAAADKKALELLKNSPYADKLASVGLFMSALQKREHQLPNLIHAHLGNTLIVDGQRTRMSELQAGAPQLEMRNVAQIPALPMGSRLKVDPWTDRVELSKAKPVALASPSEKLLFEVTPVFPYITRYSTSPATVTAAAAAANK